jgi:hypothetical protein
VIALRLALAHLLVLAAGDALAIRAGVRHRATRFALAIALGALATSAVIFFESLIFEGHVSALTVAPPLLLVASIRPRPGLRPRLPGTLEVALALPLFGLAAANAGKTLATELRGDAANVWEIKAGIAFEARGVPASHFEDDSRAFSHREYPWLVPLGECWLYFATDVRDADVAKSFFPLVFAALLAGFFGAAARRLDRPTAVLATIALGTVPLLVHTAASSYADVTLAMFSMLGAIHAAEWLASGRTSDALLAAALGVGAAWTKREGVLALGLVTATFLGGRLAGRSALESRRALLALVALALPLLGTWQLVLSKHHVRAEDFGAFQPGRLVPIAKLVLADLALPDQIPRVWGVVWLALGASLALRAWTSDRLVFVAFALVPIAVLPLAYAFSTWPSWQTHVGTSLNRILLPQVPTALLALVATQERRSARTTGRAGT